jgi:urease accessory protein
MSKSRSMQWALSALLGALPISAWAHHAMDYAQPASLFEGLMSGIVHPIIGIDHFLFVVALGAACHYFGRGLLVAAVFLAGAIAGTVLHLYHPAIAYHDAWVAGSLMLLGILFFGGRPFATRGAMPALAVLGGIAHGYAYGEGIIGAEATPLVAYLAGFTMVQLALIIGAYAAARSLTRAKPDWQAARAAGGVLSLAGGGFLLLSLV